MSEASIGFLRSRPWRGNVRELQNVIEHVAVLAEPDQMIISFNLASLSPTARDFWARRELVGWIPPGRLIDALRLPLLWWDVTFDRLLLYMALVRLELEARWYFYRRKHSMNTQAVSSADVEPGTGRLRF